MDLRGSDDSAGRAPLRNSRKSLEPESINFDEPPSRLLARLYRNRLKRSYRKVIDGAKLLQRISPEAVYKRCEHFRMLADDLLRLGGAG